MPPDASGSHMAALLLRVGAMSALIAAGFALMVGARKAAGTLAALALVLGVAAGFAPGGVALILAAPAVILFGAVKALQGGVGAVYGRRVGDHVAATYLIRILDSLGRAAGWLLLAPFRLIAALVGGRRL